MTDKNNNLSPNHGKRLWPRVSRCLKVLTLSYLGVLLLLAMFQRSLIYHPFSDPTLPASSSGHPVGNSHDVVVRTEDGLDLHGWLILAKSEAEGASATLNQSLQEGRQLALYFGGNAANRSYRLDEVRVLTTAGADVLIVDYRGYGDSPGSPSEEGLAQDARAAWKFATETQKVSPNRIVLFGESLGGGVAVRLASEVCQKGTPPSGLILRSTFSSLVDAAASHFSWIPVGLLMADRFPSEQRMSNITCPLLQFHGELDRVVPFRLGRKLFDSAPANSSNGMSKRFLLLPNADHNDVLETSRREVTVAITEFLSVLASDRPQSK